jgi:hypothetical protein
MEKAGPNVPVAKINSDSVIQYLSGRGPVALFWLREPLRVVKKRVRRLPLLAASCGRFFFALFERLARRNALLSFREKLAGLLHETREAMG